MADAVAEYVAGISPENRPLFGRLHGLVLAALPQAQVVLSYKMPTYGWSRDRDAGFSARHPELDNGKGTLRLPRGVAADLRGEELRDLVTAVLTA